MKPVFAVRCPSYDQAEKQVDALLALWGGMDRCVHPGETLALKVNLLRPASPEKAITTHPAVVQAAAAQVTARGGRAMLCDSPGSGYPYTAATLRNLYRQCGMEEAAAHSGACLNYDLSSWEVSLPAGKLIHRTTLLTPLIDADGIINLCKLKTHVFMGMTGAVKNFFGAVPGLNKAGFHAKLRDRDLFAQMLMDLCDFLQARLHIMDAVVAMEGDGPGESGRPRPVGWLLCSEDPVALDYVACRMIGMRDCPVLQAARKFWDFHPEEVEVVGATWEELSVPGFCLPQHREGLLGRATGLSASVQRAARALLAPAPRVNPKRCVGCGVCVRSCPQGAIALQGGKAVIHSDPCIRCYCCHELCPQAAVDLGRRKHGAC